MTLTQWVKGEGTINDAGSYQFEIWADDDTPDTFRIDIWDDNRWLQNCLDTSYPDLIDMNTTPPPG